MRKFCAACGSNLKEGVNFCVDCGQVIHNPVEQKQDTAMTSAKKQPKVYLRGRKFTITSALCLLVLIIGFYIWGNSHYSAEKTAERFITALVEKDVKTVRNLAILNNINISKAEAKAVIDIAHDESDAIDLDFTNVEDFIHHNDLLEIVENGKALLLFTQYNFSLVPQYAYLNFSIEGVESSFNNRDFHVEQENEREATYGPLAPGKYTVNSNFSGEFTEVEAEDTMILADWYSEPVHQFVELDAYYVDIHLSPLDGVPIERAYIELNGEQIEFNKDMAIYDLGPLKLDGLVEFTPIIETRWDKIEVDPIAIQHDYHEVQVSTVTETLIDEVADSILLYGEDYVKAQAAFDEEIFSNTTLNQKESIASLYEYHNYKEFAFIGQLDMVEIDFNNLSYHSYEDGDTVYLEAKFIFYATLDYHGEELEPNEQIDYVEMELIFDSDMEKWLVDYSESIDPSYGDHFTATKSMEGSKKLVKSMK